jgi:helix-turn-helix protein
MSAAKKEWIVRVPKSLICDTSVSLEARMTYIFLMGFEGKDGAPAFPELDTIARILRRHRTKAQRYIRELKSAEWLDKKKFKNKEGQFQSVRYQLLRHRRHETCLRPKALKPYSVSPTAAKPPTVNVPTNKSQFYQSPNLTNTKRIEQGLPKGIADILSAPDSRLVFDGSNWLGSLENLLGPREWKKCGAMWRMRTRSGEASAEALRNATEDFFILTPDERNRIKNPGAWITDRYMRGFDKLKALHNAA